MAILVMDFQVWGCKISKMQIQKSIFTKNSPKFCRPTTISFQNKTFTFRKIYYEFSILEVETLQPVLPYPAGLFQVLNGPGPFLGPPGGPKGPGVHCYTVPDERLSKDGGIFHGPS